MTDLESGQLNADASDRKPKSKNQKFTKQHLMLIIGIIFIMLLVVVFIPSDNNESVLSNSESTELSGQHTTNDVVYKPLQPKPIANQATESSIKENQDHLKRLEIPGEVTDILVAQTESEPISDIDGELPLPITHFTIQISAASNKSSLLAYAKKNKLSDYWIYETSRMNKPWFSLVIGNYMTYAEAEKAMTNLPAKIQAQKPWIKSGLRIKEERQQE